MRKHSFRPSVLFSLMISATVAQASAPDDVDEVIVTGSYSESLEKSLDLKRKSTTMVDSITADDVGKLPDNNLAEALQRVPGVQVSRTNGEGQQISLRGLGPSFARVLLDGMPVSAASEGSVDAQSRNREFDFDLLPSELFSQLAVSKTPNASLVEGGLSGTINLRTARPFDRPGFNATYQIQEAYQSTSEKFDPRLSFSVSNTWGDTFGALLSVTTSKRSFRTDGWSAQGWTSGLVAANAPATGYAKGFDWKLPSVVASNPTTTAPGFINESGLSNAKLANTQLPRLPRPESQEGTRDRIGSTLSFEWKPSDTLSFNLDAIYAKLDADFDRYTNNLLVRNTGAGTDNATGFGYLTPSNFAIDSNNTLTQGTLSGAKFWSENRVFQQESDFKHLELGANWDITDSINLQAKVSRADSDFRWRMTTYLLLSKPGTVTLDLDDRIPTITPSIDLANNANWALNAVRVQPRTRAETNDNFSLDLTWGDDAKNIRVGGLYNKFSRERLSFSSSIGTNQGDFLKPYGYNGPNDINLFNLSGYAIPVPIDHYGKDIDDDIGYNSWAVADLKAFGKLIDYSTLDNAANLDYQNSGSFEEENLSAYLEANYALDVFARELRINAGVRYVKTDQDLIGFIRTPSTPPAATNLFGLRPANFGQNTISGDYAEVLPSLNLSYDISEKVLGRLSVSKALTRPSPADIQPFTSLSTAGVVTQGNPDLDPYLSNQVDLGLEWYFEKGAVLGGNAFYKEITGFVQRQNVPKAFRNAAIPLDTITDPTFKALLPQGLDTVLLFNTPVNLDSVTYLRGIELLYQQHLDMIMQGLGLSLNYTRLDSGKSVITGLAEDNYNAVVYYETDRYDLRFSYNYRGDYVECNVNCGSTSPEVQYRNSAGYLDFASSLNFSAWDKDMTVTFEILNLLDEEEYSYNGYENRAASLNRPGRQIMLGLRGKF
ncbi:TonB-dependent receptor [Cellvibrio zantedeschiae]|uniref:TonB-dependent receptor n=1 Tax=Cellvibrio zantedeschiae TaxID=1237077 RepID=A0ABQ3AQW0_9GAMM|nr:TonB-dependent receptor [Cellvibrio zantedeschiae]GGY63773.1 TonB-dependent receptor [Cellvibrio zantedeschiae]